MVHAVTNIIYATLTMFMMMMNELCNIDRDDKIQSWFSDAIQKYQANFPHPAPGQMTTFG